VSKQWEEPQPPRGVAPWIWALIAVVLLVGIGGAIAAVALARSDDESTVDASGLPPTTFTDPSQSAPESTPESVPDSQAPVERTEPEIALDPNVTYTAVMTTTKGDITIELDTANAPIGAAHFINLAQQGFYDGLIFHRVVPDFVIQGGDPEGTGMGGSGNSVVAEPPTDGYPIGSLAAAKTQADPAGTFDSQFFIVTGAQGTQLPNDYARFGMVTSGLEVAQAIEALAPAEGDGAPTETVTIQSVTITETPK
jgi:peptidyl-prolyl cis-trans isomerase B (cyclophilin B)